MAEIKLCTLVHPSAGGPDVEHFHARLKKKDWPGGGTVDIAILGFGQDTIEVWPVPEPIREMIERMKSPK